MLTLILGMSSEIKSALYMSYFYQAFKKIPIAFLLIAFSQRALAIDIPVTNNNNTGAGSLAAAIVTANGTPGADVITFALPVGQETIVLTTPLASIIETVFIDGYSQAGSVQGPIGTRTIVVNIDATATGGGMNTFVIDADNVTIAGLAIYGAPNYNIALINSRDNFEIWGCPPPKAPPSPRAARNSDCSRPLREASSSASPRFPSSPPCPPS